MIEIANGFRSAVSRFGANTLQCAGLACVAVGFFLLAVWLGWIVAGLLLCLIGWAVDK